jgi:hypothetical protein
LIGSLAGYASLSTHASGTINVTQLKTTALITKTMNITTFKPNAKRKPKAWTRKGKCPSCGVGGGSRHNTKCKLIYKKYKIKP